MDSLKKTLLVTQKKRSYDTHTPPSNSESPRAGFASTESGDKMTDRHQRSSVPGEDQPETVRRQPSDRQRTKEEPTPSENLGFEES